MKSSLHFVFQMCRLLFCVSASRLGTQVHINNRVASYLLSGYSEMAKKTVTAAFNNLPPILTFPHRRMGEKTMLSLR